jgi:hypothetical protein
MNIARTTKPKTTHVLSTMRCSDRICLTSTRCTPAPPAGRLAAAGLAITCAARTSGNRKPRCVSHARRGARVPSG